jgi:UPF0755 protein
VTLALSLVLCYRVLFVPAGPGAERPVTIPPGSGTAQIAGLLHREGLIGNALGFRIVARLARADMRLKAGEYRLSPAMPLRAILAKLVAGEVVTYPVTIPEGYTVSRIAILLEEKGFVGRGAFEEAARQVYRQSSVSPASGAYGFPLAPADARYKHPLEGYLYPETYQYHKGMSPEELIRAMLANLGRVFDARLRARAAEVSMSPHEVLTLASIVEKEAMVANERPVIAAVYLNRLHIGMKLDADPTVKYALDEPGVIVTLKDLQVDSPYNTYRNGGLPPGPIGNPGRAAIEAVLYPAKSEYLYFVARGDGSHAFASTWEEHVRNLSRYSPR